MTDAPTDKHASDKLTECADFFAETLAKADERAWRQLLTYCPSHLRLAESHPSAGAFKLGDFVQKKSGASWRGKVVGFYSTNLTPRGYCVESANELGSVQIYPEAALAEWKPELSNPSAIREAVEGEREACAKIAERFAEQNRQQAIESKRRANKLNGLGGEMAETLAESAEIASMECDAAFHEADAIAAAIRARGEEKGQ